MRLWRTQNGDSPTDTPTSSPTPTPTPRGVIIGHVTWQGISQPNSRNTGITATLSLCVGGTPQNYSVATDAGGYFTITTGLTIGSYNWRLKGQINLANSGTMILYGFGGSPITEMGTKRAGDCNNDNVITVSDFNVVKGSFGKSLGQPGYDARADFNRDNLVSSLDFSNQKNITARQERRLSALSDKQAVAQKHKRQSQQCCLTLAFVLLSLIV